MVLNYVSSKLTPHGFEFYNWPGDGEQAAEFFGLSHAVIVPPNARRVIIGGQIGLRTDQTVSKDVVEEVQEAFEHVEKALRAAGLGDDAWEFVYQVTTYEVSAPGLFEAVQQVAKKYLKTTRPAWTGVTVASLVHPDIHLEIAVEAYLPAKN